VKRKIQKNTKINEKRGKEGKGRERR